MSGNSFVFRYPVLCALMSRYVWLVNPEATELPINTIQLTKNLQTHIRSNFSAGAMLLSTAWLWPSSHVELANCMMKRWGCLEGYALCMTSCPFQAWEKYHAHAHMHTWPFLWHKCLLHEHEHGMACSCVAQVPSCATFFSKFFSFVIFILFVIFIIFVSFQPTYSYSQLTATTPSPPETMSYARECSVMFVKRLCLFSIIPFDKSWNLFGKTTTHTQAK